MSKCSWTTSRHNENSEPWRVCEPWRVYQPNDHSWNWWITARQRRENSPSSVPIHPRVIIGLGLETKWIQKWHINHLIFIIQSANKSGTKKKSKTFFCLKSKEIIQRELSKWIPRNSGRHSSAKVCRTLHREIHNAEMHHGCLGNSYDWDQTYSNDSHSTPKKWDFSWHLFK